MKISGAVENRDPISLEIVLKYAIKYETRHQLNPQYPSNNFYERYHAQLNYSDSRDRSLSPHVRDAALPERNRSDEVKQSLPGMSR